MYFLSCIAENTLNSVKIFGTLSVKCLNTYPYIFLAWVSNFKKQWLGHRLIDYPFEEIEGTLLIVRKNYF